MPDYMTGAEPFDYAGNRIGCLLIHGLTGTPFEVRELGRRLAAAGYTVSGPALAGHATCLADMEPTRWEDWYGSVTAAYQRLRAQCDAVFPIGLSLGGLLALHLAAHEPVDGVVAVSAPFGLRHWLIPFFQRFPILFRIVPRMPKDRHGGDTLDPRIVAQHPEYRAYPTRCVASMVLDLIPHLTGELSRVQAPALLIQSRGDRTIPAESIGEFHARLGSSDKQMVWIDKSGHLILEDLSKEEAFAAIATFLREHTPAGIAIGESRQIIPLSARPACER
jgi:carboxylesterase